MKLLNKIYLHQKLYLVIALCVGNVLFKIPLVRIPPFSDPNVYYNGVFTILNNHFSPFAFFNGFKPPLLFELTAILFQIFGPSYQIGSMISLISSSLILFYTYLIGKRVFNEKAGFWACILLFFFPLFQAQSFQFTDAIFVTPLLLATIYYYITKNKTAYLISASLAVLTRETSISLPLLLAYFELIKQIQLNRHFYTIKLSKIIFLLLPLLPFIVWMYLNRYIFGWFLVPTNVAYFFNNQDIIQNTIRKLNANIFETGFFIILINIIFIFLLLKKLKITRIQQDILFIACTHYIMLFIFYIIGPYHPRYMLSAIPLLFIIISGYIMMVFKTIQPFFLMLPTLLSFIGFQVVLYFFAPMLFWGEGDLSILQTKILYEKSIQTIQSKYKSALIVTVPWVYSWNDPSFGYAENSILYNIHNWNADIAENIEFANILHFANEKHLYPIIYIQQSNDIFQQELFAGKKTLIENITINVNKNNYHQLYRIIVPTINE